MASCVVQTRETAMRKAMLCLACFVLLAGCKSDEEKRAEFAESVAQGIGDCSSKPGSVDHHIEVICSSTTSSEEWVEKIEPAFEKKCGEIAAHGFDVFIVDWGGNHRDSIACKK